VREQLRQVVGKAIEVVTPPGEVGTSMAPAVEEDAPHTGGEEIRDLVVPHPTDQAARRLVSGIPAEVRGVPTNIFRTALHPAGLAGRTRNLPQWSAHLLRQLDRAVIRTQDATLAALADEIATWPSIPDRQTWSHLSSEEGDDPVVPWRLEAGGQELSFFTTMSTFGTPMDITLSELSIDR
jgi:hypothetical protein